VEQSVPYDQPVVWMLLEGRLELRAGGLEEAVQVQRGETVLLPARMKDAKIKTLAECQWLEITFGG
jgi:mannose-6-phosphate isomerase class I